MSNITSPIQLLVHDYNSEYATEDLKRTLAVGAALELAKASIQNCSQGEPVNIHVHLDQVSEKIGIVADRIQEALENTK